MSEFRWDPPSEDDVEEISELQWAVVRTGLLFVIFSIILYSLLVFFAVRILESSDITTGALSWTQSCGLVAMFIFARMWNRAFFK